MQEQLQNTASVTTSRYEKTNQQKDFVLDTNILINDPMALFNLEENNVVIPMTVLEELDKIKDGKSARYALVAREARTAIHFIAQIINGANSKEIAKGIKIGESLGNLRVLNDYDLTLKSPCNLPEGSPDNRIIEALLFLQEEKERNDSAIEPCLLTRDLNLRLKAKSVGVRHAEDYRSDQVLDDLSFMDAGYEFVEGNFFDSIEKLETIEDKSKNLFFIIAELSSFEKTRIKSFYPRKYFIDEQDNIYQIEQLEKEQNRIVFSCKKMHTLLKRKIFGVKALNEPQALAIDALTDNEIDGVFLVGPAGSGKTLLAVAAGLSQTIDSHKFSRIIVLRNTTDLGESIGYLPGTEEEKVRPYLEGITDAFEYLVGSDDSKETATSIEYLIQKANLQFKSVNTMRGRSLLDTFIILDESQNLTAVQLKALMTRVGKGSKICVLGNLNQIDDKYLTSVTSGLLAGVEAFKSFNKSACIVLKGGERSDIASFTEENM